MAERTLEVRLAEEADAGKRLKLISEALCPPKPQLLDTCVLQNLDWIDRKIEASGDSVIWDDAAIGKLNQKCGAEYASDLIDLGILYEKFEYEGGYPWLVCEAAEVELSRVRGPTQERLGSCPVSSAVIRRLWILVLIQVLHPGSFSLRSRFGCHR